VGEITVLEIKIDYCGGATVLERLNCPLLALRVERVLSLRCRQPLEARKARKSILFLEPLEGNATIQCLDFSFVRHHQI
jgi:hypothetical protein